MVKNLKFLSVVGQEKWTREMVKRKAKGLFQSEGSPCEMMSRTKWGMPRYACHNMVRVFFTQPLESSWLIF